MPPPQLSAPSPSALYRHLPWQLPALSPVAPPSLTPDRPRHHHHSLYTLRETDLGHAALPVTCKHDRTSVAFAGFSNTHLPPAVSRRIFPHHAVPPLMCHRLCLSGCPCHPRRFPPAMLYRTPSGLVVSLFAQALRRCSLLVGMALDSSAAAPDVFTR